LPKTKAPNTKPATNCSFTEFFIVLFFCINQFLFIVSISKRCFNYIHALSEKYKNDFEISDIKAFPIVIGYSHFLKKPDAEAADKFEKLFNKDAAEPQKKA